MRSKYILIAVVLVALAFGVGRLSAAVGTLDSPDVPGNTLSYTLEDIYNRLNDGTEGAPSTFTEPAAGPGTGTMHDLDQIMTEAPAIDGNPATTAEVKTGQKFWGLGAGAQWGLLTGGWNRTVVNTTVNQAAGYYDAFNLSVVDTDLVSPNIRSGVSIYGVDGDPMVVNTSSGTATASDILSDTVAYVDGLEITGTMTNNVAVTIVPTTTNQTIALGYHDGSGEVLGDTSLVSDNIKSGVDIFGVAGELYGGCTCTGIISPTGGTRWCDNLDGTVTDLLGSGGKGKCLVWLKKADWGGGKAWREDTVGGWDDAHTRAGILKAGTPGADRSDGSVEGDWRLPTKSELVALTTGTEAVLSSDPRAFTGVHWFYYWSSTTDAGNTDYAWVVYLVGGGAHSFTKTHTGVYVWPVRGGQ